MSCNCGCASPAEKENPCLEAPCSTAQNLAQLKASYYPEKGTDCAPICLEPVPDAAKSERVRCTDPNGCTGLYPAECRDGFWPVFAHPRWLCCADLYAGKPV